MGVEDKVLLLTKSLVILLLFFFFFSIYLSTSVLVWKKKLIHGPQTCHF